MTWQPLLSTICIIVRYKENTSARPCDHQGLQGIHTPARPVKKLAKEGRDTLGRLRQYILTGTVIVLLLFSSLGAVSADIYDNFSQLKNNEQIGKDYRILQTFTDSSTLILSIHGGNIEFETDDIAQAVAKRGGFDYYGFIGLTSGLHLTSTHFNDPRALKMVRKSDETLSIHGYHGTSKMVTLVGGQDKALAAKVKKQLKDAGFTVKTAEGRLGGYSDYNICNRNEIGKGVQLELSTPLRRHLASDQKAFDRYVDALVRALN